jgi:cellulose biosynthesis protein BcsQ
MKRITLFAGHYGSGKTNIAVNYALWLKSQGKEVTIADLDIVNPYFRTKDSADELEKAGIELISPQFANSNVDLPALPPETYKIVQNKQKYAVLDIGGDDRGAYALGRYAPYILEENDYEMVFVANFFRPLTRTPLEALEVMREIELAGGIKFTAIANNSNVGELTTAEDVFLTDKMANELAEISGLPLIMTTVETKVANKLREKLQNVFVLNLQKKLF